MGDVETEPNAMKHTEPFITATIPTEETLHHGEEQYREIFEASVDSLVIFDTNGVVVEANPAATAMYGYSHDEMIGLTAEEIIHPDYYHLFEELKSRVKAGGEFQAESVEVRKDGTPFNVEVRGRSFYYKGRQCLLGVVRDITERKQAEEALRTTARRYSAMLANMSNAVAVYRPVDDGDDFVFADFNPAAERIDGINKKHVIGRRVSEVFPGVKEFGLFDVFQRVWRTGAPEHHPVAMYKDERISGWRENYVYKLPSGEIVAIYEDATERKQAEEALQQGEQKFKALFDGCNDAIVVADPQAGRYIDCNKKAQELSGYSRDELLSMDVGQLTSEERKRNAADDWRKPSTGEATRLEWRLLRKDGRHVPIEVSSRLIEVGDACYIQTVIRDITERKHAEYELRAKMRLNQVFLDALPCVALLVRRDHEIALSNKAAADVGAFPGKRCFATWGQRDDPCQWCLAPAALATGRPQHLEVEAHGIVWDARWIPIGPDLCLLYAFDITDRKRAEDKLRRLAMIAQQAGEGIAVADLDGNLQFVNAAWARMHGYEDEDELIGEHLCVFHTDGQMKTDVIPFNEQVMRSGYRTAEVGHVRKDGTTFPTEMIVTLLKDEKDEPAGLIGFATDITEKKSAEKKLLDYQHQLRSLASELSLAEERERREIATVLHDRIAQPLAVSKMKLAAIRQSVEGDGLSDSVGEVLALMEQAIQHTRSLTREISPPILYESGLEEAVRWLADQFGEQYGVKTEFEGDGGHKPISDDIRVVLFQAVRELLVNIANHAKAQTARVSVARHGDMITVTVQDDGIGFEPDEIGPRRDKEGGFGLFNIRERLRHLGGRLEIESEPGRGSTFALIGPLVSEQEEEYAI